MALMSTTKGFVVIVSTVSAYLLRIFSWNGIFIFGFRWAGTINFFVKFSFNILSVCPICHYFLGVWQYLIYPSYLPSLLFRVDYFLCPSR